MIEQVNFIERELFTLSYRKMALGAGSIMGAMLVLFGLTAAQVYWANRKITALTQEVNELKARRDKVMTEVEAKAGAHLPTAQSILDLLEKTPRWSLVLKEVARKMPPRLWMVSLKSYQRDNASGGRGLILSGEAENPKDISLFLEEIAGSRYFEKPVLSDSKQEKRGNTRVYVYTIDSGLTPVEKGGNP